MKTKEEAIKEAWGDVYESIKNAVGTNGWFDHSNHNEKRPFSGYELPDLDFMGQHHVRPSSLTGIESNNGWIRIESEDDLPKEDNKIGYLVIDTANNIQFTNLRHLINRIEEGHPYTHYKPIVKPKPPIY